MVVVVRDGYYTALGLAYPCHCYTKLNGNAITQIIIIIFPFFLNKDFQFSSNTLLSMLVICQVSTVTKTKEKDMSS